MKKAIKKIIVIFLILITVCLISIWISYNCLTVSKFTVTSSKISELFRMVLISDLHDHRFGKENEKLVDKILQQNPDLVILDGDIINGDSENDDTAVSLVRSLAQVAPVYYSFGNHEFYYMEEGHQDLQEDLVDAGAIILNYQNVDINVKGNSVRLGGLYEYGFETSMQTEEDNQKAISYLEQYVDTDRYLIMCAHRPDSFYPWNYADQWGIDLVLSGHLHGGQVVIPGVGGLYSQLEGFFPQYDYGQYKIGGSDMIITRGLSSNPKILPRFNNPPEIVVVDVQPE